MDAMMIPFYSPFSLSLLTCLSLFFYFFTVSLLKRSLSISLVDLTIMFLLCLRLKHFHLSCGLRYPVSSLCPPLRYMSSSLFFPISFLMHVFPHLLFFFLFLRCRLPLISFFAVLLLINNTLLSSSLFPLTKYIPPSSSSSSLSSFLRNISLPPPLRFLPSYE